MEKISIEQVQGEVRRFWNTFTDKSASGLMEFYGPDSTVFSSVSSRSEPGRLAAARREREYFHPKSTLRVHVAAIDVVLLGDESAVASYNFQFYASKVGGVANGNSEEDIKQGRATHVFRQDIDGKLRLVHEHLSSVEKG